MLQIDVYNIFNDTVTIWQKIIDPNWYTLSTYSQWMLKKLISILALLHLE